VSGAGALVLVVEDEQPMRRFLRAALTSHGYRLLEADSVQQATAIASTHNPEVILLDLGLPDGDGIEFCRTLRGWTKVPIIVLSARGREDDKIEALDAGADDYLTKPFGIGELLARLRVALRHAQAAGGPGDGPRIDVGPVSIDRARREITIRGGEVHMTPTEYRLLAYLLENAGKVLTHRQILQHVWGPNATSHPHYVRVQVAELRKKIETDPARPRWLVTEPGVGYRFRDREPGH
jgi:two-component system KDP operon response regulator KdpE